MNTEQTARAEYERRLADRVELEGALRKKDRVFSVLRFLTFGLGILTYWMVLSGYGEDQASLNWLLVPPTVFFTLVIRHAAMLRRLRQTIEAVAFYKRALARLDHRWAGTGTRGERFRDPAHLYADDLDLYGKGSVFEMLCTARTRAGEETLSRWLAQSSSALHIRARQAASAELSRMPDLREELWILGHEFRDTVKPRNLEAWAIAPAWIPSRALHTVAVILSLAALAALLLGLGTYLGPVIGFEIRPIGFGIFGVIAGLNFLLMFVLRHRVAVIGSDAGHHELELKTMARVLERLEREKFEAPRLKHVRARLDVEGIPPSRQIARLSRWVTMLHDAQSNQILIPLALALLWPLHLVWLLEAWRARVGPSIGSWIAAAGEIEALCALGGYAYEHPNDIFPEIVEPGPAFDAESLGHPLLPDAKCVRNDVNLGEGRSLLLVSGSNMSGKSTLLRAIGVNAVLAMAGAPVRAKRMRISPLTLGASICVHDSLMEGSSRFYAEIKRLRAIVECADGEPPLLFLIDEMLNGTNSHDRRMGAEAVIKRLVERGAIGLVTTHDLALAAIADELGGRATNVHFEDQIVEGRISFDYRMRPGTVTQGNALALMRAIGIEV